MSAWSRSELASPEQMWGDGASAEVIAVALGVTRSAVCGKVHRMGLPKRRTRTVKPRIRKPVAARAETAASVVVGWTSAEIDELRARRAAGATYPEIAAAIGRTPFAVRFKARSLGLSRSATEILAEAAAAREARLAAAPARRRREDLTDPGDPAEAMAVRFLDRRADQCAAILDPTTPILARLVCGSPISGATSWCAHHRLRYRDLARAAA